MIDGLRYLHGEQYSGRENHWHGVQLPIALLLVVQSFPSRPVSLGARLEGDYMKRERDIGSGLTVRGLDLVLVYRRKWGLLDAA